jgi:hypothetical protein
MLSTVVWRGMILRARKPKSHKGNSEETMLKIVQEHKQGLTIATHVHVGWLDE